MTPRPFFALLLPLCLAAGEAPCGELPKQPPTLQQALAIGWPGFTGPAGTFETAPARLVDDLSKAKLLWTSEFTDLGNAKGGSKAFREVEQFTAESMAKKSHPGSWAGPVVADGLVLCASWRPCGEWRDVQGHKVRLDAEDLVVAIDPLTGKTRWLAVEPGGLLRGGGKREGMQIAPVCGGGAIYSVGSTGRIFAHEIASGKKRWESEALPARAAAKQSRDKALAALAAGQWPGYDLNPNWGGGLAYSDGVVLVPDQDSGLLGVDAASGARLWHLPKVMARWATPAIWRHGGRDYILCANERGELRLIDGKAGTVLWKLDGLGPNWPTLTPGRTHVLVNIVADSGDKNGRKPGAFGAIRLSPERGERDWTAGGPRENLFPVWMDGGARFRVLYRDGRFLLTNAWQNSGAQGIDGAEKEGGTATTACPGKTSLLIEEATGKVLARLPASLKHWNDQLGGLVYWCGDRLISRADSFHGPTHGGRHPWIQFRITDTAIERLPGTMDLAEFANGYEVPMDAPLVGGLMFERTLAGGMMCFDLRAP